MGVTQLWQVLGPVERHQSLAALQGLTLAVDLSIWVCETQCVKQMQGVVSKPFLRNLFFRISHLTQLGVKLVFVIEGSAPELKWEVMMQRQQSRYPGRQGKPASQRPVGKQTRRNFNACLKECCELLDILGIPYVQSRGEAEAMCALLDAAGLVDGCLTNDGDAFLYGARTVYRNFTMNSKDPHVEMYQLCDIENQLEIDRHGLIALGLLLGCDFVPKGVPGIGVANATKLLQSLKGMDVLKRLQEWRKMSESQCVNQAELLARRKAISMPDFPQLKVIQEFMTVKDRCPSSISPWKRPLLAKFQDFALVKLEWPQEYTLEKMLPLISLWDMQDVLDSSNPSTHQHLKPHRIVKTRVRQGIPCYEVEWYKPVTDTSYDGDYYVTVESQELFARCYPHVVHLHEMETAEVGKKRKKSQGKKKKKNSEKADDNFSDTLNNISFNFDKMNLGVVTAKIQQSVKSLPTSLPEFEVQQSQLTTKIKAQKQYSAGHAVAPGGSSHMAGLADTMGNTPTTGPPPVTPTISHPTVTLQPTSTPRPTSITPAGLDSPVFIKTVDFAATHAIDSDEENLLPFLERVKLRMQAKQSQSSNSQKVTEATANTGVENSGRKSGKKKNKKKIGSQQGTQADSQQYVSNSAANTSTTQSRTHSKNSVKIKPVQKSSADLSDMNSLLDDIENLSLLRENAQRQTTDDANRRASLLQNSTSSRGNEKTTQSTEPDRLKQRLSFSSTTQKQVSSPVTPFGTTRTSLTTNFRKMSSPHCEDVLSPMSYIHNSGELSESFEIQENTPGNIHRSTWSKKKAKKARRAARLASSLQGTPATSITTSAIKNTPNMAQQKIGTPTDQNHSLKTMKHMNNTPSNLSDIDLSAVKDFGDFKIQHSLLNSLCASLVQAITPKGISQEEYEKLCAALNKLDDQEKGSTAAHDWIEAEVGRSLQQVGRSTAQAVSHNIHKSFLVSTQSPAGNTTHASMQAAHKSTGIDFESEEYKNLSKTARKKLRRKERQLSVNGVDNSSGAPGIGGDSCNGNVKPRQAQQMENLSQSGKNSNSGKNTAKCKSAIKENIANNKSGPSKIENNATNGDKTQKYDKINFSDKSAVKQQAVPTSGTKLPLTGAGDCINCLASAHGKHPSVSTSHTAHQMTSSQVGQAKTSVKMPSSGFFSQPDHTHSVNGESLDGVSTPDTISSEDQPKKKKKKKKKKVKKADAITNLSADDSMGGGLQQMLCSQYLKKAVENLKASFQTSGAKITKASPVMDLSADDTVLELEDLSSQLAGIGPSLDAKTKLKLARKRSSLEKMKACQQETQTAPGIEAEAAASLHNTGLGQTSAAPEPVLSLNKAITESNEGKAVTNESRGTEKLEKKLTVEGDEDIIKVDNHMYKTKLMTRDDTRRESVAIDDYNEVHENDTERREELSDVKNLEVINVDESSSEDYNNRDKLIEQANTAITESTQIKGERVGGIENVQDKNGEMAGINRSRNSETVHVGAEDDKSAAELPDLRSSISANISLHCQSNQPSYDAGSQRNKGQVLYESEADDSEESFEVIVLSDEEEEEFHADGSTRYNTTQDRTGHDGCEARNNGVLLSNGDQQSLLPDCDLAIDEEAEVDAESVENGYIGPNEGLCDGLAGNEHSLVKIDRNGDCDRNGFDLQVENNDTYENIEESKERLEKEGSSKNKNKIYDNNDVKDGSCDKNGWTNGSSDNRSLEYASCDTLQLHNGQSNQNGLENGCRYKNVLKYTENDTNAFSNGEDLHNGINDELNRVLDENDCTTRKIGTVCNSNTVNVVASNSCNGFESNNCS